MVTKEEYQIFYGQIEEQRSIYDLLVLLYRQIEGCNLPAYEKEYYQNLHDIPDDYWKDLRLLNREMLTGVICFETYLEEFRACISQDNMRNMAIRMLLEFDGYIGEWDQYPALTLERSSTVGELFEFGPMNQVDDAYALYFMPADHYFKDCNQQNGWGIRYMDQSGFSKILDKIKHYKIIKTAMLPKNIHMKYYSGMDGCRKEGQERVEAACLKDTWGTDESLAGSSLGIKVGIVPVSAELWHNVHYEEYPKGEKYYFRLEDKEEKREIINHAYIRLLKRCMREGIQMVVFPELAQNKETLGVIRNFLIQETMRGQNSLELIFLGSLWLDGVNEGILLNGVGTELLRTQKMKPFYLKKDGKKYWEYLCKEVQSIDLIDIPPLGRIQYLICKDGLNEGELTNLRGVFEIALAVISAYSESVSYFEESGEHFCRGLAGIQVLANACAPRIGIGQREIGHMMIPCAKIRRNAGAQKIAYMTSEDCGKAECFGKCIHVFEINPDLVYEKDHILGNYVLQKIIMV